MQRSRFSSGKPFTVNLLRWIKGISGELAVGILYERVGERILGDLGHITVSESAAETASYSQQETCHQLRRESNAPQPPLARYVQ